MPSPTASSKSIVSIAIGSLLAFGAWIGPAAGSPPVAPPSATRSRDKGSIAGLEGPLDRGALEIRGVGDGRTHRMFKLTGMSDDDAEKQSFVVVDSTVVLRVRSVDDGGFYVLRGPRDYDYLIQVVHMGPPGTCIGERLIEVYTYRDSGDPNHPLGHVMTIPIGGYLDCADGAKRSCGCGVWDAKLSAATTPEAAITVEPFVTFRERVTPPAPPPKKRRIEL